MDTQLDWVEHYKTTGNPITGINTRDDQNALVVVGLKTARVTIK